VHYGLEDVPTAEELPPIILSALPEPVPKTDVSAQGLIEITREDPEPMLKIDKPVSPKTLRRSERQAKKNARDGAKAKAKQRGRILMRFRTDDPRQTRSKQQDRRPKTKLERKQLLKQALLGSTRRKPKKSPVTTSPIKSKTATATPVPILETKKPLPVTACNNSTSWAKHALKASHIQFQRREALRLKELNEQRLAQLAY